MTLHPSPSPPPPPRGEVGPRPSRLALYLGQISRTQRALCLGGALYFCKKNDIGGGESCGIQFFSSALRAGTIRKCIEFPTNWSIFDSLTPPPDTSRGPRGIIATKIYMWGKDVWLDFTYIKFTLFKRKTHIFPPIFRSQFE